VRHYRGAAVHKRAVSDPGTLLTERGQRSFLERTVHVTLLLLVRRRYPLMLWRSSMKLRWKPLLAVRYVLAPLT